MINAETGLTLFVLLALVFQLFVLPLLRLRFQALVAILGRNLWHIVLFLTLNEGTCPIYHGKLLARFCRNIPILACSLLFR